MTGDGDVCGGVDRCWSHDSSAVNASLCYYPCSASTSATSASAARSSSEICTTKLDRAPSVDHRVTRRPSTRPRLRVDGVPSVEATVSPLDAPSKACRPRCSPVFCLIGVAAALLAAVANHDRLRDSDRAVLRVRVDDDREFPRDAGEFPLPVVNYYVVSSLDAAVASCSWRSCTSVSYCCRTLANRTIKS